MCVRVSVFVSHQERSLGVLRALDAQRVKLALLQAALHQADGAADATLDVLERRGREALPQLVVQHLPDEEPKTRRRERQTRGNHRKNVLNVDEHDEHLKSDSSTELAWLIMAQRQSMLELDKALLMHFFTM